MGAEGLTPAGRPLSALCQMVSLWFNSFCAQEEEVSDHEQISGKSIRILLFSHASTSCVFLLTSLGSSCLPCPSCSLPAEDMVTGGPCVLGQRGCLGGLSVSVP